MKFLNRTLLILMPVFCTSFYISGAAFGLSANGCHTGGEYQYCGLWRKCKSCPANCYCPSRSSADSAVCTGWTGLKCEGGTVKSNTNHAESNGFAGVYACPSDYPTSDAGAKSAEQCYWKCNKSSDPYYNKVLYNKATSCSKGQYRPKGSNECKACPKDGKSICEGVSSFKPLCAGAGSDQGIRSCDTGTQPNSNSTACEKKPEEKKVEEKTEEVNTDPISVEPGYYLPKGSNSKPKQCSQATYYCPGGDYVASTSEDKGKFKCPSGSTANTRKTACTLKIPKDNLKFGPDKNMPEEYQCWMSIGDPAKYKSCVLSKLYYK